MAIRRVIGCVVGFVAVLWASFALADTVYRAERIDSLTGKRSFEVTIFASEQATRVDVQSDAQRRVSLIELNDRLVLIDFANRVYVVHDIARSDDRATLASFRQPTARRQFALGAYCNVFEVRWSDAVYEERCAMTADKPTRAGPGTRVGEFLGLIAATGDAQVLFDLSTRAIANAMPAAEFPLVVRRFSDGKMLGEVRVLGASHAPVARNVFDVPRGLRRTFANGEVAKQALR